VLALDPRGHGASSGRANDWGWFGEQDVPAAVTWLTEQDDVDPERIAVVGLSMGGEEAIGAAGVDPRIRAVVAEGVTGRSGADLDWLVGAYGWRGHVTQGVHRIQTAIVDLLGPASPPPTLREAAAAAAPRPILIVTAGERPDEALAAESIRSATPGSVEVWEVPGATHTAGLSTDPDGWRDRVVGFLGEATS
jgi:pimeloyl-ACP methyl ester carboxylesterase